MSKAHKSRESRPTVQIWTFPQAQSAAPYIAAVLRSLREYWLEARAHERRQQLLDRKPGRPGREGLVEQAEALRAAQRARDAYEEAEAELRDLGIVCEDVLHGQALLPCAHHQVLAWIRFDLFAPEPLRSWRYHNDPPERERPIAELMAASAFLFSV